MANHIEALANAHITPSTPIGSLAPRADFPILSREVNGKPLVFGQRRLRAEADRRP